LEKIAVSHRDISISWSWYRASAQYEAQGAIMAFDYKKEYRQFYLPPKAPEIVTIPQMQFIAVEGKGDPNQQDGEYQYAMSQLYGIAFTIKMSKMGDHRIDGYYDYVVPPLEGFWWMDVPGGMDYAHKESFRWISCIRIPDFVTQTDVHWAIEEATRKKKMDFSKVKYWAFAEGTTVQCMHIGPFDNEPATIEAMDSYAAHQGYRLDFTQRRKHHEIYLSDARKTAPERLRTVIRHPIAQNA
jgi:hypothetical protein